ncbi:DUF6030 family protein [Methylopila musalis]|uniref:DUF6030 family protein n=1 Tax=Methylopila musalis TaxID=1134781 RepID=A0ABW3ZAF8_9HYPH
MNQSRLTLIAVGGSVAAFALAVVLALGTRTYAPDPEEPETGASAAAAPSGSDPAPHVPPAPDPLADLLPETVDLLTSAYVDAPARFILTPWVTPKLFCDSLKGLGLTGATLHESPKSGGGWTCVTDLVKPVPGPDETMSSLFVSARGLEGRRLDVVRLKLNLLEPKGERRVRRAALDVARALFDQFRWRRSEAALTAIHELRDVRFRERGVTFELKREFGAVPRYNMIVTFERWLPPGPTDRFAPNRRPLTAPARDIDAIE